LGSTAPTRVAFRHKRLGLWEETTYARYAERVAAVAMGLADLGVQPGDRVAIQSDNRPEWLLTDLAVQGLGAITVGVYPTSPEAELVHVLTDSGATVLVAEDEEQLDKALAVRAKVPSLRHLVVIDAPPSLDESVLRFADVEARGAGGSGFAERVEALDPGSCAIVVYTSGTTGPPKGAMLSHANLAAAAAAAAQLNGERPEDEVLSYLPLCHIAERILSVVGALRAGYTVNFGEGGDSFAADLREVQPTVFLGVPRVWEKLLAGTEVRISDATWAKRHTYRFWVAQGRKRAGRRQAGRLSIVDRVVLGIGWLVLFRSLREKLGMSRVREALSGAAPIAPQVLEWLWAIGVPVREVYGQTENTAMATNVRPGAVRIGTVGQALPGVEVRLADDGEVLTRSPGNFLGYWGNEAATAEVLDAGGWLHTGDVGTIDGDGFLTITDRKKDIIVTAGGKNIAPSEIENRLKVSPFIREAIIVGDRRKFVSALIGIEADTVADWAGRQNLSFTTYRDLTTKPEVLELVREAVGAVNAELAQVEEIKSFRLLPAELDEEEGELTATQKVKRAAIAGRYAPLIEEMYSA
ncbi:MAG: AMP-dependent synthetase and ligase, partial [Actinomycetia bacterium]|nr:AMP-dependent synthetase and ligase [Actinomycetes bacterium]